MGKPWGEGFGRLALPHLQNHACSPTHLSGLHTSGCTTMALWCRQHCCL